MYLSEVDRIRSIWGGTEALYPIVYPSLFDPEDDGNLSSTGSLTEHTKADMDYWIPLNLDPLWMDPISLPVLPSATNGPGYEIISAHHFLVHRDTNGSVPTNFAKALCPEKAHLLNRASIIGKDAPSDIYHILLWMPKGVHVSFYPPPPAADPLIQTGEDYNFTSRLTPPPPPSLTWRQPPPPLSLPYLAHLSIISNHHPLYRN